MKRFNKILQDIKDVKIQGAKNIAIAGIKAYLLSPTKSSAKKILTTRSTEPLLQNAIKILAKSKSPEKDAEKYLKNLKKSQERIAKIGSSLIKNDMNVYVHCHSSTVMALLKYAKKKRKKHFVVYTTEVEPLLQGHLTAKDLASSKIKVIIFPDMAAENAMKNCDLFLFGADAYTKKFTINKIGTSYLAQLSKMHKIPTYSCGVSKKFTKKVKIEKRNPNEVWNIKNKSIQVQNPAFDKTPNKLLTGIISEFGILKPKDFVRRARKNF